jgi:hypothetical protein
MFPAFYRCKSETFRVRVTSIMDPSETYRHFKVPNAMSTRTFQDHVAKYFDPSYSRATHSLLFFFEGEKKRFVFKHWTAWASLEHCELAGVVDLKVAVYKDIDESALEDLVLLKIKRHADVDSTQRSLFPVGFTIGDVLRESVWGDQQWRMLHLTNGIVDGIFSHSTRITATDVRNLRLEPVPEDQAVLDKAETLLPVQIKPPVRTEYMRVLDGEPFVDMKERMAAKFGVKADAINKLSFLMGTLAGAAGSGKSLDDSEPIYDTFSEMAVLRGTSARHHRLDSYVHHAGPSASVKLYN